MKTYRVIIIAILTFSVSVVFIEKSVSVADEVTKYQKLLDLMILLGVNEMF